MGTSNSLKLFLKPEEIKAIQDDTEFTLGQISHLHSRFTNLDKENKGFLERGDLLAIPELAINPLGDRIVHAFFSHSLNVADQEKLHFHEFVQILAIFQPLHRKRAENKLNTQKNKLMFSFRMYDLDGDGEISKVRLF